MQRACSLAWDVQRENSRLTMRGDINNCAQVGWKKILVEVDDTGKYRRATPLDSDADLPALLSPGESCLPVVESLPLPPTDLNTVRAGRVDGVTGYWRYVASTPSDPQLGPGSCHRSQCEMRCNCGPVSATEFVWSFVPNDPWLRPAALTNSAKLAEV